MPVVTRMTLDGAEGIQQVLLEIPKQYQKRALRDSFKAGAEVVAAEAQAQARKHGIGQGGFAESIVVASPTKSQRHDKRTIVVIALKKAYSGLAHIFEYGTGPRFRNSRGSKRGKKGDKAGGSTGQITATPFLRPAFDIKGQEAIKVIIERTWQNIESTVSSLAKGEKVSFRRRKK